MSTEGPSRHLEVERKYDVEAFTEPPSFDGIAGVARAVRADTQTLDAIYYDTADRDLASRRITLRRRTGGLDAGWHLKLPAGPDARTEVRAPLNGTDPPAELLDVVLAIVRDQPVRPAARISTIRQITLLYDAAEAMVAEFCDDQVTASRDEDGTAELRWREWELEIADADPELLTRVGKRLIAAGARPAGHGSKLARVLDTTPDELPTDPLHRALAEQIGELLVWDRAVRAGADDAVHQMRVTARTIRSLLQASPGSFALSKDAAVIEELRELGNVLGVARDAEVLAERYRDALDAIPSELVRGPIRERLVEGAERRYTDGLAHAVAAMRLTRYFRLLDVLEALITRSPADGPQKSSATIATAGKKVRKAARAARHASAGADRDDAIHRIRKRAKRLRYTADATGATKVSKRAKKVQSLLGDHQDSVVSRDHLLEQADAAHAAGEDTFTYGLLHQREANLASESRQQLDPTLARLLKAVRKLL